MEKTLHFFRPDQATKQLKIQSASNDARKLVISSNLLSIFGFEKGKPTKEESLGTGKGFTIKLLNDGDKGKKVYSRTYKHRKNNPCELMLDCRRKDLLEDAIPKTCEKVHITFRFGVVTVTPITSHQAKAIENAKNAKERYSAFVALSSGVDAKHLQDDGFSIHSLLDTRIIEARDKSDLSETGCLTAMHNVEIGTVYNEDIYDADIDKIAADCLDNPFTTMVCSPLCDDFSSLKNNKAREDSIEKMDSTIDMMFPILEMVKKIAVPTLVVENVSGFASSQIYQAFELQMRRLGYQVLSGVYDARDYGGLTSRKRTYAMFSCLPAELKAPVKASAITTAGEVALKHESTMRDISDNKSIQKGKACGRLRSFNANSKFAPTPVRSQSRMAKDTLVFEQDGRFHYPSNECLKELMGIDMSFECVGTTIESEQIGQAVDIPLSRAITNCIKEHLDDFFEGKKAIKKTKEKVKEIVSEVNEVAIGNNYGFNF
ncbi:hypothetical protein A3715_10475 [Oleiphilus sp. HI0009]|nr:hypothetical protein A3715_10475 [Oleiphilus sp. HI0009]